MSERPTEAEGTKFLNWLVSLDPAWKDRVDAMRGERHISDLQCIGILCSWTLESGMHMEVPVVAQLMDGFTPVGGEAICPVGKEKNPNCLEIYVPEYPGKPYCSNECAAIGRNQAPVITKTPVPDVTGRPKAGRPRYPRDEHGNVIRDYRP